MITSGSPIPERAMRSRSWAPMGSVMSWASRAVSAALAGTTRGGVPPPSGQPDGTLSSATAPGRSPARASSVPAAGSHTPRPVVALPWGSKSITRLGRLRDQAAEARPSATVVLPTPPFWLTIATEPTIPR